MINSKWKESPYRKLMGKLFWHTMVLMVCALLTVLVLSRLGQSVIGGVYSSMTGSANGEGYGVTMKMYQSFVQENIVYISFFIAIILFLIFFRLQLGWFTKYFDEIAGGIDGIVKGEGTSMSPEMDFISHKLNNVQYQLMRSNQAEKEAEQRKNDLVVYLAHDIKTPLTSVIGYLSLMDDDSNMTTEQRAEYTHIALEKAYRLERLIEEFFDITRYNLADMPIHKSDIDLAYMLAQLVDEAYPQLDGRQVEIDLDEDITLSADAEKLARVFNNLLRNAIAYGEENSTININATRYGKGAFITVKNQGEIPPDKVDRIFDKFYRMDDARQSTTGGAGLGLAIARDIITLHGGTIKAKCQDGYTVFTIFLPDVAYDTQSI